MSEPLEQLARAHAHELRKLAEAAKLGQAWTCAQGLRATQLVNLIRGASFEARTPHLDQGHDPVAAAHRAFDRIRSEP